MEYERKTAFVSKKHVQFYKDCYGKFGYRTTSQEKKGFQYILTMERSGESLTPMQEAQLQQMEEKFRIIEVIDRKKPGIKSLFLNLLIHAIIFFIQAVIFSHLHLDVAHPQVMLRVGIVVLQAILIFGFVTKLLELFRWNSTQQKLKQEAVVEKQMTPLKDEDTYYISVLFTRGIGWVSDLIYYTTGRQYTHSAIGLGKDTDTFYSFNFKGFRTEHPAHRRLRKGRKNSLCYQFQVSEKEYRQLEDIIMDCLREKEKFGYNFTGTIFCILHIYLPFKRRYDYFCSEFVSEQLQQLNSFHLKKAARMYVPNNLAKVLSRQPNLYRVLIDEV